MLERVNGNREPTLDGQGLEEPRVDKKMPRAADCSTGQVLLLTTSAVGSFAAS